MLDDRDWSRPKRRYPSYIRFSAILTKILPLPIILKGLSMLAAPTGCDGIVDMKAFDQLGDIGSLSSLTSLLP
jgi:hypothetical protein